MSLLQNIRHILSAKKRLSLTALAKACRCSTDDVETQLCFYLHKGLVKKKNLRLPCGTTCQQCDLSALVIYEWVPPMENHRKPLPLIVAEYPN